MASDASTSNPNWINEVRERNKLTDFQAFRLFFEGVTTQNKYRSIGKTWWIRNMGVGDLNTYTYVTINTSNITGSRPSLLNGVRPSV